MTPSEAHTLQRARELIAERRKIDAIFITSRGVYRERLVARRKAVVALMRGVPTWALQQASGEALRHAMNLANENYHNDGAARLIRWAESRYQTHGGTDACPA